MLIKVGGVRGERSCRLLNHMSNLYSMMAVIDLVSFGSMAGPIRYLARDRNEEH